MQTRIPHKETPMVVLHVRASISTSVLLVLSSPSLSNNTPSICQALYPLYFLYCVLVSVLHINLRLISAFEPRAASNISFEHDPFRALL